MAHYEKKKNVNQQIQSRMTEEEKDMRETL